MTKEEAVKMLRTMQRTVYLGNRKFEDAIECAIKALSEPLHPWEVLAAQSVLSQPEPHWIPVTERLPDNSRNVLITSRGGVSIAWYNGSYFEKGANTHHREMQTVTAWCELPEPFKGVNT